MTALETPLSRAEAGRLHLSGEASRFTFAAERALTTVGIRMRAMPGTGAR
jgi:hypothetical protein